VQHLKRSANIVFLGQYIALTIDVPVRKKSGFTTTRPWKIIVIFVSFNLQFNLPVIVEKKNYKIVKTC